ncbi:MAG: transposase [Deltaproteobacteria bacterium]|nr:transposase [Deltaproteobacteria bacterium]
MPRQARLDIPGLLQHVIVRGIERSDIFMDDIDQERFLERFSSLLVETCTDCFAWALLHNHFHLLLRCNHFDLSRFMRRLLTGYAVTFNRRHARSGHLFQNRYKSIVCEEEPYLLELIRYIHLNPLRAGLVKDLEELESFPWCGHGVLLGRNTLIGQTVDEVLALFANRKKAARHAYRQFLYAGVAMGKRPELVGGGLRRSQLIEGNIAVMGDYDERVLGGSDFVASLHDEPQLAGKLSHRIDLNSLQASVSDYFKLPAADILRRGRRNQYSEARELFCYLAVRELGYSGAKAGTMIGMGTASVSRAARRGENLVATRPEMKEWWVKQLKQ